MKQFNLEEYLKNPSRKVITRDGRSVKIHCTNYYLGDRCIIAEVEGSGHSQPFNRNGKFQGREITPLDLFFVPEKHEGWVTVYKQEKDGCYYAGGVFDSKEKALEAADNYNYVSTTKIEWEE